jgi:hypothetical protein
MRLEPARGEEEERVSGIPCAVDSYPLTISRLYTPTVEGLTCKRRIELRSDASVKGGSPPASLSLVRLPFTRTGERDTLQVPPLTAS